MIYVTRAGCLMSRACVIAINRTISRVMSSRRESGISLCAIEEINCSVGELFPRATRNKLDMINTRLIIVDSRTLFSQRDFYLLMFQISRIDIKTKMKLILSGCFFLPNANISASEK